MPQSIAPSTHTFRNVESPPSDARVRHFDELSDRAQEYVIAMTGDTPGEGQRPLDIRPGDVIVFTSYLYVDE